MSIIFGILLIVLAYFGGGILGYKFGNNPATAKVALGVTIVSVLLVLASIVSPALAMSAVGRLSVFVFPLALGTYRGAKIYAQRNPQQPPQA